MQFDTLRTDAGEAVFQLKYKGDFDQVKPLAMAVVKHIVPLFEPIGFVVPAPASVTRARQPVQEVAMAIAKQIRTPIFSNIVTKIATVVNTPSLKNMSTKAEKVEALKGRFTLNDAIGNNGKWNVLVVDDLYDSGATLDAICAILASYPKVGKIYVAALTWK
jgi:predicted amidophosphoribosyltransferase